MKKLIPFLLLLCLFSASIYAQTDKYDLVSADDPFILLTNDSILYLTEFTIDEKLFQTKIYRLDGTEIKTSEMKYMGLNSELFGFYHNSGYETGETTPIAIRREIGEIDLYAGYVSKNKVSKSIYYSKRFEGLKPLKYKSLKNDLLASSGTDFEQRNAVMLEYLEKGKRKQNTAYALLGSGFVVFMVGAAIADKNERSIPGMSLSLGGLVTMIVGLARTGKDKEVYLEAARAYNRF